ncbi:MAG: BLUF domain-containing protein [Steroidobacteraceae bacterium]
MDTMPYELVYASWITAIGDQQFLLEMVQRARAKNARLDVTSMLQFDGDRFLQLLEGEEEVVKALAGQIERDPRHQGYALLHAAPRTGRRRFTDQSLAFAAAETHSLGPLISRNTGLQLADHLQATPVSRIDFG